MNKSKILCTCKNTKCKLHQINHDLGCTPCIEKNLKMDEMPNCFFDKIDPEHKRKGTKTKDYAEFLLKVKHKNEMVNVTACRYF